MEDIGVQTDLIQLLSINKNRSNPQMNRDRNFYNRQAFLTAGRKFKMIDDYSVPVLVPYNDEAKEIITQLRSDIWNGEMVKILRKAQKYTVGLFEQAIKKLNDEHALEMLSCGAYVLDERFYDCDLGVTLDGKPMDLLMF